MRPFRIAILIFFLGASIANFFATDALHGEADALLSATPAPTPSPRPHENGFAYLGRLHSFEVSSTPAPQTRPYGRQVIDIAVERETIIIMIAGVAWFLARKPRAT